MVVSSLLVYKGPRTPSPLSHLYRISFLTVTSDSRFNLRISGYFLTPFSYTTEILALV